MITLIRELLEMAARYYANTLSDCRDADLRPLLSFLSRFLVSRLVPITRRNPSVAMPLYN